MAIKYNKTLTGQQITDEFHNSLGSDFYSLDQDTFWGGVNFDIYTAAASGGTHLVENTHYTLHDEDTGLTSESGATVYTTLKIIDVAYQACDLYFTYKTIGDYNDAKDINSVLTADLFQPKPWNKSFFSYAGTQLDSGAADTDTQNKLVDSGATFSGLINVGDVVYNSTDKTWATVLIIENTTTLVLDWDCFPDGNENYEIYDKPSVPANHIELTGAVLDGDGTKTADTDTVNHLLDADGIDWTTIMNVGDWAMNLFTGLVAKITTVAAHDLTLQWDCFPNGNEPYLLYSNTITVSDSESRINGLTVYEMNISGRFVRPGMTAGVVQEDMLQEHIHWVVNTNAGNSLNRYGFQYGEASGVNVGTQHPVTGTEAMKTTIPHVNDGASGADGNHGVTRTGAETRPRNLSMVMIMRIK